jgi:hypothetical protein
VNAECLLETLRSRGILVRVNADRLCVDSPPGALTAELRAELQTHKPELLALLSPKRRDVETLAAGPYAGFLQSANVPQVDSLRGNVFVAEAERWRESGAAWLRQLRLPNSTNRK